MMRRIFEFIVLGGFLVSAALAVHYKDQAAGFREKLGMAGDQAQKSPLTKPHPDPAANQPGAPTPTPSPVDAQAGVERENRIRRLEAELQGKDALIFSLQQAATNRPADPLRPARRMQAWLDDLKQSNPQQYEALTNRREQVRQEVQTSLAEKADYLRARDASALGEEEKAAYQRMAQLLDETWQLAQQLQTDLPSEERRAIMQTIHQDTHELEPLLAAERSKAWYDIGVQLGYSGDDALAFKDYLNQIIDLTSMPSIYRGMRGGVFPRPNTAPGTSAPAPER